MGSNTGITWLEKLEEQCMYIFTNDVASWKCIFDAIESVSVLTTAMNHSSERGCRLDGPGIHQEHADQASRPDKQPALGRHPARG